ncbi:MAG: hypothetical protein V2L15_08590 [Desulfobacteraceae bacterium]|jgi:hypothetical protein|nr:hypothetical protein [Desulfobacteraceae bacterium]
MYQADEDSGAIGIPVFSEVKIVDETGAVVDRNVQGEIDYRGLQLAAQERGGQDFATQAEGVSSGLAFQAATVFVLGAHPFRTGFDAGFNSWCYGDPPRFSFHCTNWKFGFGWGCIGFGGRQRPSVNLNKLAMEKVLIGTSAAPGRG